MENNMQSSIGEAKLLPNVAQAEQSTANLESGREAVPVTASETTRPDGFPTDLGWEQIYRELAEAIRQAAPRMISAHDGVQLLNVSTVLDEIIKFPEGTLVSEPAYETVEECLGDRGLRLPFIEIDEMWFFALHLVDASEEEKVQFQMELDALSPEERMRLEAR
jgi:hypothetical protein